MTKKKETKKKKPISIASRKAKARKCQQWAAKKISDLVDMPWGSEEVIASREMGQTGVDVRLIGDAKHCFPWSIEAKWQETWNVPAAIRQAKDNQMNSTDWLVVMKKNQHDYVVVLDGDVFFDLLRLIPGRKKGR